MDEIKDSFKQLDLDHMDENMFTDCDNMDEIKRSLQPMTYTTWMK
jgi:hypothetical protein